VRRFCLVTTAIHAISGCAYTHSASDSRTKATRSAGAVACACAVYSGPCACAVRTADAASFGVSDDLRRTDRAADRAADPIPDRFAQRPTDARPV
jgi:hypothetical protein